MEPRIEGWNIVVTGSWNLSIFNPSWVSKNLFSGAEIQVEFPLTHGLLSPRYSFKGVLVFIEGNRLVVHPQRPTDEDLQAAEDAVLLILTLLPHTPVAGVGVNFRYAETAPSGQVLAMLRFPDDERIAQLGYQIAKAEIGRQVIREDHTLNFRISRSDDAVVFDFNHHSQVDSAERVRELVGGHTLELQRQSLAFLESIYAEEAVGVGE